MNGPNMNKVSGTDWAQVDAMTDDMIDTSDSPPLTKDFFESATWIVSTEGGQSNGIVPLDEYNAWQETLYLLSNPANADHIRRSIAEAEAGKVSPRELIDL